MGIRLHALCLNESTPSAAIVVDKEDAQGLKVKLMRKLTWLVLISYTLLMFKPVMPIVMDVLAHTFWEQQHMLVVHEVNGKFHLHDELVNASHQTDKHNANNKYQVQEYFPVTMSTTYQAATPVYSFVKSNYSSFSCYYPFPNGDTDYLPPEA